VGQGREKGKGKEEAGEKKIKRMPKNTEPIAQEKEEEIKGGRKL